MGARAAGGRSARCREVLSCPDLLVSSALIVLLALPGVARGSDTLSVENAREHLESGRIDEVYLGFADLRPGAHPAGDEVIATLLVDATRAAIEKGDGHLALALAGVARRVLPMASAPALAYAEAALLLELRGAAAEALDEALERSPGDGELIFRRARLAELDRDFVRAMELYAAVPRGHARYLEAEESGKRTAEALSEHESTLEQVARIEAGLPETESSGRRVRDEGSAEPDLGEAAGTRPPRPPEPTFIPVGPAPASLDSQEGMSERESRNFRIVYHRGDRDFAQRADFEVRILAMLEDAQARVGRLYGYRPPEPIEVVLYTAEEFQQQFGGRISQNVLGFYAGKIRMNRAEAPRASLFRRTVVHEYVHAVVDQLSGGNDRRIPMWLNEGLAVWTEKSVTGESGEDEMPPAHRIYSRRQAHGIPLSALAHVSFGAFGNPTPAYIKSRAAVEALVGTGGGLRNILRVIEETGAGKQFETAFAEAFGERRLDGLDGEANRLLEKE